MMMMAHDKGLIKPHAKCSADEKGGWCICSHLSSVVSMLTLLQDRAACFGSICAPDRCLLVI